MAAREFAGPAGAPGSAGPAALVAVVAPDALVASRVQHRVPLRRAGSAAAGGARESLPPAERRAWDERVVISLDRVVNNQYAEMERPYDTVSQDPDFSALRSAPEQFPLFRKFLDDQRRMDYPDTDVAQARLGLADLSRNLPLAPSVLQVCDEFEDSRRRILA